MVFSKLVLIGIIWSVVCITPIQSISNPKEDASEAETGVSNDQCWKACSTLRTKDRWVCHKERACAGCGNDESKTTVCKTLDWKCPPEKYGGLDCDDTLSMVNCYNKEVRQMGGNEALTYSTWHKEELPSDRWAPNLEWYRNRKPHEPIVGESTMIAGVLFTFTKETLKLTAVFPPLYEWNESSMASLVLTGKHSGETVTVRCQIVPNIWICPFRVENISHAEAYEYQVQYKSRGSKSSNMVTYDGVIPKQVAYPRIAAISCFGLDQRRDKDSLVEAILHNNPDLIVLQGDQTYLHKDLGYGFLETIYTLSKITKSIPTIVQMDDHDYGFGNLYGAGDGDYDSGAGFEQGTNKPPVCLLNAIEQLAMSHNPDSANNGTLDNGLGINYTNYMYGNLDLAILEARKFKSNIEEDTEDIDNASLLGEEQELWLQNWCNSDTDKLKIVLTQTPFAQLATHNTNRREGGLSLVAFGAHDSNGYPPAGRKRAMEILSGCSPLVLSGDQHMSIAVTYEDYEITECASPAAINSIFWRLNKQGIGGKYEDIFGNEYTVLQKWNVDDSIIDNYKLPKDTRRLDEAKKQARADGFMMVKFDGNHAVCEAHSYRNAQPEEPSELIWEAKVAAALH